MQGRKQSVDYLFEVVVDLGLPFLAVGPDPVLGLHLSTLKVSRSKSRRSMSGSSASKQQASSAYVPACSFEL